MPKITGGCLCGSVRYASDAEPVLVAVCHCGTCQKYTGSAFSLNLGMPSDSVTITGESLATYEDRSGASGNPFFRTFCSRLRLSHFGIRLRLFWPDIHQGRNFGRSVVGEAQCTHMVFRERALGHD
jgi:hypothetical protein